MRILLVGILLLGGCRNACQALCVDINDYAVECGFTPPSDGPGSLKECLRDHGLFDVEREDRQVCRTSGDDLREEWTCDDLAEYFDEASSSADDTGAADTALP